MRKGGSVIDSTKLLSGERVFRLVDRFGHGVLFSGNSFTEEFGTLYSMGRMNEAWFVELLARPMDSRFQSDICADVVHNIIHNNLI